MDWWHLWSVTASLSDGKWNSAVNRNLACIINNWNNSYYLWTNKVIYDFCMIIELLIWFKKKSLTIVLILLGDRSLSSISFSTGLTVIEYFPYPFALQKSRYKPV